MMEFTFSRVTAMICGALILSAVIVPFTGVMDDREDRSYQSECDSIAEMMDTFSSSRTEELILSMNTLLPSSECSISFDGHMIRLHVGEEEFQSVTKCDIISERTYTSNDVVRFLKTENGIVASGEGD